MNDLAVLFLEGCFTLLGAYFVYCMISYWELHKSRKRCNPYIPPPNNSYNTLQTDPHTRRKRALDDIQSVRDDPIKRRILIDRLWPDREPTPEELELVLEPPPENLSDLVLDSPPPTQYPPASRHSLA